MKKKKKKKNYSVVIFSIIIPLSPLGQESPARKMQVFFPETGIIELAEEEEKRTPARYE